MTRPEVVFFDFGDTLWHFPHSPSCQEILAESLRRISGAFDSEGGLPIQPVRKVAEELPNAVWVAEKAADDGDPSAALTM